MQRRSGPQTTHARFKKQREGVIHDFSGFAGQCLLHCPRINLPQNSKFKTANSTLELGAVLFQFLFLYNPN